MGWQDAPIVGDGKAAWESAPLVEGPSMLERGAQRLAKSLPLVGPAVAMAGGIREAVQGAGDLGAGAVRGAGSIGATILAPYDYAVDYVKGDRGKNLSSLITGVELPSRNEERRAAMDGGLQELGANPDSMMYGAGKLAGEVAGTAGAGSVLAGGARAVGAAPAIVEALATGGMRAAGSTGIRGAALRAGAGAATGAASAGMVDPSQALGGAAVGAVAPVVVGGMARAGDAVANAARGTVRGARAAVEPFTAAGRDAIAGRVLTKAAGDGNAAAVAQRLGQAGELVPGSIPTAAQVGESGGIAALERAIGARRPEEFAERAVAQSGARARAVEDIAGDAGKKELFSASRQKTAQELYERAYAVPIEAENLSPAMRGEVSKLMGMPAVQAALKVARQNAANHGMKLDGGGSIAGLHHAKLAMDDMISELTGATGAQANKARAIEAARDRLVTFMEKMSPDYGEARATYAAMSKPINQMDTGQVLLEKLRPALGEHGAVTRENANSFAQALRTGDQTVKKATGRSMKFDEVMDPEQIASLTAVARDLGRKVNAQDLGRGVGSNTFQQFAMNNIAEQAGAPRVMGAILNTPILTKLPRALYEGAEEKIETTIAQALLNPRNASQMMQEQLRRQALAGAPRQPMLSPQSREIAELLFARTSPQLLTGQ